MDELSFRVEFVDDGVCVCALAGCEGYHFEVLVGSLQETESERSNSDVGLLRWSILAGNIYLEIIFGQAFLGSMKEGFVEVNNQHFFALMVWSLRKVNIDARDDGAVGKGE